MAETEPEQRRRLPSVDALLRSPPGRKVSDELGRPLVKRMLSQTLGEARAAAARGVEPPEDDILLAHAAALASRIAHGLVPVINATGVVLHTGLGRAPLPDGASAAAARAGRSYGDLEVDRETGARGKRTTRAEAMLTAITGADAALVVNNNAAALLLALASLARRREVLVSRGELIEIGGEFRLPDVMAASGAKLVEVGTTNRTRAADYRSALSQKTALVLKVHPSNYRVVGFTTGPSTRELAAIAGKADVPLMYDLGSGLLDRRADVPAEEPAAAEALRDGADLVCFSGDKLLGGPQAGIVLGRAELVDKLRRHAVARAVRVDKMQVAALEMVLRAYVTGRQDELPVWRMLRAPEAEVKERARQLSEKLDGELEGARIVRSEAVVGGGSMPGFAVPSWAVALDAADAEGFAARLRTGAVPVFCRVEDGSVLFDLRTVRPDELPHLARAIGYALEGDDRKDG